MKNRTPIDARPLAYCIAASAIHQISTSAEKLDKEAKGLLTKKYGHLTGNWREELRKGFAECFRVLKPQGTLIFKWAESDHPVSEVLALTPEKPLFGHKSGKKSATHWIAFMKPNAEITGG